MWNVYGVWCDTWEQACTVAGIETPAQLAAEERYWDGVEAIAHQDAMEARGGPIGTTRYFDGSVLDDDIPF